MIRAALTATLLLTTAPAALAFEVTGGSVQLGYSTYTDNLLKDLDKTSLQGSIEVAFGPNFVMQADLGFANYGVTDEDSTSIGLHSIYALGDATALGLYFNSDQMYDGSLSSMGLEMKHQAGIVGLEGYLGYADDNAIEGMVYGARADFDISGNTTVGLRYDGTDKDVLDLSRLSLTGEHTFANGFALTAELGSADVAGSGSEGFVGIGAKMAFGRNRGATFNDRSVLGLLPGL